MSEITEIETEVNRLRRELSDAEKRLHDAKIAASPIVVGSIYVNREGGRGQVVGRSISFGRPYGVLKLFKKDGSLGERTARTLDYGWKLEK